MSTRTFAMLFGIVFLVVGVLGFLGEPFTAAPHGEHPAVNPEARDLLGLFPVNMYHNVVHVLFGLWGLAASRSAGGAVTYARGVAIIYALLTVMGFVPALYTTFGFIPLYGNDIWLHGLIALVAAYFGWVHRSPAAA